MYQVDWTLRAELTFYKEIDFILSKWSYGIAEEFINLVDFKIDLIASGKITGRPSKIRDVRILSISKQTSLAYKIFEDESKIELLTFWNNKINPKDYQEFLDF